MILIINYFVFEIWLQEEMFTNMVLKLSKI